MLYKIKHSLLSVQNHIAAIAVVIFGLWLFSGIPTYQTVIRSSYDHSVAYPEQDRYASSYAETIVGDAPKNITTSTDYMVNEGDRTSASMGLEDGQGVPATKNSDGVNDQEWYSGLMQKARSVRDRIINIDITGNANNGAVITTDGMNPGDADEYSMLPQPTESESVEESKPNCPSVQYMGGNAYGRNMLIKMGCPIN